MRRCVGGMRGAGGALETCYLSVRVSASGVVWVTTGRSVREATLLCWRHVCVCGWLDLPLF